MAAGPGAESTINAAIDRAGGKVVGWEMQEDIVTGFLMPGLSLRPQTDSDLPGKRSSRLEKASWKLNSKRHQNDLPLAVCLFVIPEV